MYFKKYFRRRLHATAECDECINTKNKKAQESDERKQAMFYRRLVLLARNF